MHKRTKIKVAMGVLVVGMACMLVAVVTDHWAVLSPRMKKVNETCEAAHFGLWRLCKKNIYIGPENYIEGHGCGPISLPGGKEDCLDACGRKSGSIQHRTEWLERWPSFVHQKASI